jgi:hypothetical protein
MRFQLFLTHLLVVIVIQSYNLSSPQECGTSQGILAGVGQPGTSCILMFRF